MKLLKLDVNDIAVAKRNHVAPGRVYIDAFISRRLLEVGGPFEGVNSRAAISYQITVEGIVPPLTVTVFSILIVLTQL